MTGIDALLPHPATDLTDAQLLEAYAPERTPWLRMNFVTSLDGAATRDGRAGGLGSAADKRVFDLLRWWADVVLLGAGTVRDEGYGAMRLPAEAEAWRVDQGLSPQPVFALVTQRLDLDPASPVFTEAPVTPLLFTVASAPADRRAALAAVAEVIDTGQTRVDPARVLAELHRRGHGRIHGEGGPTLFGSFLAAGLVDELCLTLAPTLQAGPAPRIAHAEREVPATMQLRGMLRSGDELLLRYTRRKGEGPAHASSRKDLS